MIRFSTIMVIITGLLFACREEQPRQILGTTMGTTYQIKISANAVSFDSDLLKMRIDSLLREINRQMSTYIPTSEISRFNARQDTQQFTISEEFMTVLNASRQIYRESGGAFDVTVGPLIELWGFGNKQRADSLPQARELLEVKQYVGAPLLRIINDSTIAKSHPQLQINLSAVAKGYGVDKVARFLQKNNLNNFLVEIGGEVVVRGQKTDQKPWQIGIDRPRFAATPGINLEAVLKVKDVAIATSGDYRNYFISGDSVYSHTIDPVSGRPIVNGVASVTVIAPTCMLADAMATAITVMGEGAGLRWVEKKENVEAMIIIRDGDAYRERFSSGFESYLAVQN